MENSIRDGDKKMTFLANLSLQKADFFYISCLLAFKILCLSELSTNQIYNLGARCLLCDMLGMAWKDLLGREIKNGK